MMNVKVFVASKKNKKNKKEKQYVSTEIKDLGSQQLFQLDGKLYRTGDFRQMVMGLKHLYCKINSVLENYYFRNQLDPQNHKKNALRYVAGMKIEYLAVYSGKTRSQTFNWDRLQGIPLGSELFNVQKYDAEFEYNYDPAADPTSDDFDCYLNSRFFAEALRSLEGDQVYINWLGRVQPLVLKSDDSEQLCLVMPIQGRAKDE